VAIEVRGQVGPGVYADGADQTIRLVRDGGVAVGQAHGRYLEAALRGNCFLASQQAAIALTAGLSSTNTGLALYNPVGSGVLLAVNTVIVGSVDASANTLLFLVADMQKNPVPFTAGTQLAVANAVLDNQNGVGAGAPSKGKAYTTVTLKQTPVAIRALYGVYFKSSTAVGINEGMCYAKDGIAGEIVVPEGVCIAVQATAAISVLASISWEEIPKQLWGT